MTFRALTNAIKADRTATDYGGRLEPLRVCTDATTARVAALSSVESHCECGKSWTGHSIPPHKCTDAAGRDLTPMKEARAAGARRQLEALRNFAPSPDCTFCGAKMPSGSWHECAVAVETLPHDAAAAAWQRGPIAAAIAEEKFPNAH
jgi:hypothetical protein